MEREFLERDLREFGYTILGWGVLISAPFLTEYFRIETGCKPMIYRNEYPYPQDAAVHSQVKKTAAININIVHKFLDRTILFFRYD